MEIPDIPFDPVLYTWVAVLIALPIAFFVSLALLWAYLRAVRRSMLKRAAGEPLAEPALSAHDSLERTVGPPERPLQISTLNAATIPGKWAATRRLWLAGMIYAIAGFAFAYVTAAPMVLAMGQDFNWQAALILAMFAILFYAWPIVITLSLVCAISWLGLGILVLVYALVLAAMISVVSMETTFTAGALASQWFAANRDGSLLAFALLARPIRAVGPLVGALMIAAVAGAIYILFAVYNCDTALVVVSEIYTRLHLGVYGTIALMLLAGAIPMGLMAWLGLRWFGRRYRAHRFSDQSIMIDGLFIIFAIEYSSGWWQRGPVWLLTPIAAFLAYKIVATGGLYLLRRRAATDVHPKQLVLLRVFSLGRRSRRLFDGFSKLWRHVGAVRMIAGPDLATSTVEPHEFLDFIAGRLQRRFITGSAELEQRLLETEPRRDPDGRYRSSSFFCYDDTWKMVLGRLVRDGDAVLMDLRGFTAAASGCIYEINELLNRVPLDRIVFVIDRTTDEIGLAQVFFDGWARLAATSPNRADLTPRVRLVRLNGLYGRNIAKIVALLAARNEHRREIAAERMTEVVPSDHVRGEGPAHVRRFLKHIMPPRLLPLQ
jgi:hypothetical protein